MQQPQIFARGRDDDAQQSRSSTAQLASPEQLLDKLEELHASPGVAWRAVQILKDPDYDVYEVESLLESDPGLSASILRLVNSSAFGLPRNVTNLRQAITLLGARSLRLAVLSFGLVNRLTRGTPSEVFDDFWRRALTTAVVAGKLARREKAANPEDAYCAGLLAEIGVLVFCQVDTRNYLRLYLKHRHCEHLPAAEQEHYGFDHATLGACLLNRWGLPNPLPMAAAHHHQPNQCDTALLQAVHAGTMLGDVFWVRRSALLSAARQWLEKYFAIDLDGFISLANECKGEIHESAEFFSVKLKGRVDVSALKKEALEIFKKAALETALEYDSITAVLEQRYTM
ncbi:MAG: HDOD domain-containing protein [Thermogutta sp.]|uniref:HDOD domain-containing protein n=1 Tax=Thermogutta sp. TaxID=1962930 RepID=UPI0019A7A85C|nr:HDOD domain-containing protein [Thermogutta sp.]MBC7351327.1 HDOD domain-containing protein [Thermogutta sp.]